MVDYPPELSQAPREPGPDEVRYVHKASVYWRAALTVGVLLLAYCVVLNTWNTALIRHQQVQNRGTLVNTASAAQDARTTAAAVYSCVTPGQSCYERAQRQTGAVLSDVRQIIIAAAACSSGLAPNLPTARKQALIQTCVIDRLAVTAHKR